MLYLTDCRMIIDEIGASVDSLILTRGLCQRIWTLAAPMLAKPTRQNYDNALWRVIR